MAERRASAVTLEKVSLPPLGEVLDFLRVVWAVNHGIQSRSKRMETALGVTGPQRFVIRMVGRFPGISAGQLAQVMKLHPSTMTGILARLESKSLISRRQSPTDGRRSFLGLTKRGRALKAAPQGTIEAAVEKALKSFSMAEISIARAVLEALANTLVLRAEIA